MASIYEYFSIQKVSTKGPLTLNNHRMVYICCTCMFMLFHGIMIFLYKNQPFYQDICQGDLEFLDKQHSNLVGGTDIIWN